MIGVMRRLSLVLIGVSCLITWGCPSSNHGYTLLHEFSGPSSDGAYASGEVAISDSMLYGMAAEGGTNEGGVVFRMNVDGTGYVILHNFGGTGDGVQPERFPTISDSMLYGMTWEGGSDDYGVVFRMNTDGTGYAILHNFTGNDDDGVNPIGSPTISGSTLYGMTNGGGLHAGGVVFRMNTNGTGYTVLHDFDGSGGSDPGDSLTLSDSMLYGMTVVGGNDAEGVVFRMNTDGTGYTVLHNFTDNDDDGENPIGSPTISGSTLYGMTGNGGSNNAGVAFRMNTDGTGYDIIHNFGGTGDGVLPSGSLRLSGSILYGMTNGGGTHDKGVVFRMNTSGNRYTILHAFSGAGDGAYPTGSPTLSGVRLYGTTSTGGSDDYGVVFSLLGFPTGRPPA